MRNRTIAEQISAPTTFGMESNGFRKFGRRNLGARWGRQQQWVRHVLKTTAQTMQPMTISLVSQRVSGPMGTQEVHPTRQDKLAKHNSSTWRCDTGMRKSMEGARQTVQAHCGSRPHLPTLHPTPIIVQQPRNDKRPTLGNSTITRLRKTIAKPHRSQTPQAEPAKAAPKRRNSAKIRRGLVPRSV